MLARVKRLTKKPFLKLISNHTLYENTTITLAACVPYSSDHNLDDDSWFKVEKFSQQSFCIDLLKNNFDSKDYDDLKKDQFSKIAYILAIQGEDFYFQKVTPSLYIKKKIIGFGEIVEVETNNNRLAINEQPDAIYLKQADTLIFRNLATITSIFKGIDELYREATQQETENFLQSEFINLKDSYNTDKVSKGNRKRIALAMDSLAQMADQDKVNILAYINDYCDQKLKYDQKTSQFEISTDEELKLLLYGIEQRFYTTIIGQEKRLANSITSMN